MFKRYYIYIVCLLLVQSVYSQEYANNWIDYSQTYYRIPITTEGIYRVTISDLNNYGIDVGDFSPQQIQIFARGKEVPVYVKGQNDGKLDPQDYFEFYANPNTAWLDTALYVEGAKPLNPYLSLYNDTAAYFLCFKNNAPPVHYDTTSITNFTGLIPLSYCIKTVGKGYGDAPYTDATVHNPYFEEGEGWTDINITEGVPKNYSVLTPNYIAVPAVPAIFRWGLAGNSDKYHNMSVTEANTSYSRTLNISNGYYGYSAFHEEYETAEQLGTTTTFNFLSSYVNDGKPDNSRLSYVEVEYPHSYNFEGNDFYKFTAPEVTTGAYIYIEIVNFDGGTSPLAFCPELNKRVRLIKDGTKYKFALPNPGKEVEIIVAADDARRTIPNLYSTYSKNNIIKESKFFDVSNPINQGDYVIITHKNLWNEAKQYADYRAQDYNVVLIDIDELYNQFGFGIQKHPYAIHAFLDYATKTWSTKPEHVFIIGKGYRVKDFKDEPALYEQTLVPGMGEPPSDVLFTTDLHGNYLTTNVAIGRLAANSPSDVTIYLNKVKDFEAQEPDIWMKRVLHFGGGSDATEQKMIKSYLQAYENILEAEYMGAEVHTFLKETSDLFEQTEPEAIKDYVNQGTSICTFFGHAAGNGFDQNIGHPSDFDNKGKYPLMIANSCLVGDIFTQTDEGMNEDWIFIKDKGAIGFLASDAEADANSLPDYTKPLLINIAKNNYGGTIGTSIEKTLTTLQNQNVGANYTKMSQLACAMVLHGDPAIKLHSFEYPDLQVTEASAIFSPVNISTDLLSFETKAVIVNSGKAFTEDYNLRFKFYNDSGDTIQIDTIVSGGFHHDTISVLCYMRDFRAGEYSLIIEADTQDTIFESNEGNNSDTVKFFISSKDVLPVQPPEYAIIPNNTVTLYVSAVDPVSVPSAIIFEIDTSASYDSPLFETIELETNGNAIIYWNFPQMLIDSATYFWRVSSTDSIKWNESSFTYEPGKTGWGQFKAHQFIKNSHNLISFNEPTKSYTFIDNPIEIQAYTVGNAVTEDDRRATQYKINQSLTANNGIDPYKSVPCFHVAVFDSATVEPWISSEHNVGQFNTYESKPILRYFTGSATSRKKLNDLLRDTLEDGMHILIYSYLNVNFDSWEEDLFKTFDSLGAKYPRTLPSTVPYIFFCTKGDTSSVVEAYGENTTDYITAKATVEAHYKQGSVTSTDIGPSKQFDKIIWKGSKVEVKDSTTLGYLGYPVNGSEFLIDDRIIVDTVYRLDTLFDVNVVPTIQLKNFMLDETYRTAPKLDFWKVYYTPVGEIAIAPELGFSFYNDTIQQGDFIHVTTAAKNIGVTNMDSVYVYYEIRSSQNILITSWLDTLPPMNAGDVLSSSFSYQTTLMDGDYTVKIEYNPINKETGDYYQHEVYHFNNFVILPFYVQTDIHDPVLDVIVDGRHAINGDIISTDPEFIISLYDENEFLFLQDTSNFSIQILQVATGTYTQYYFVDTNVLRFIPSADSAKICRIYFNPEFLENGVYELHMQATDASGNKSGVNEYVLSFEIDDEQKVSVLYNYPNPCFTYTIFRFILSGTTPPESAQIEIFNEVGQKVSVIYIPQNQLHIGTNIIDVSWDGTDKYGVMLPSGVYLYRLVLNSKSGFDHYATNHDAYIHRTYGKLIIAR